MVHIPAAKSTPGTTYTLTGLFTTRCWKKTKRSERSLSETGIRRPALNRQRTLDEMMKSRTNEVDEVKVKTEENVLDIEYRAASSNLALHLEQAFQKVREAVLQCVKCTTMASLTSCKCMSCLMWSVLQKTYIGF